MNKAVTESLAIILGVATVFLVQISFLSDYQSYLLAFLIIFAVIYITLTKRTKKASQLFTGSPIELFGLTAIMLFIVSITNGLNSPLFFFLYFVLFLFAFMSSSMSIWIFLLALLLYFLPQASSNFDTNAVIKLGSLVLIAPISFFVAKELERRQLLNQQIQETTSDIVQEAEAIKESGNPHSTEEIEAIDEIIEEAEALSKETKD